MDKVAREVDPNTSGDLGRVRLKDLPPRLRKAVRELPVGEISPPVRTPAGYHLLMVCERIEPEGGLPDRAEVHEALMEKRLKLLSRRYLRDIRRSAFVDVRI